jgi:hypothetical protein
VGVLLALSRSSFRASAVCGSGGGTLIKKYLSLIGGFMAFPKTLDEMTKAAKKRKRKEKKLENPDRV